jgi:hypothetical protein
MAIAKARTTVMMVHGDLRIDSSMSVPPSLVPLLGRAADLGLLEAKGHKYTQRTLALSQSVFLDV